MPRHLREEGGLIDANIVYLRSVHAAHVGVFETLSVGDQYSTYSEAN
jgi:hypothetical protein